MTLVDTSSLEATPASRELIVIERTHPSQTPAGLAILSHLANTPTGCLFPELYALFSQVQGSLGSFHTSPGNLRGRLAHLELKGYVTSKGRGDQRRYHLGDLSTMPARPKVGAKDAQKARRAPAVKVTDCGQRTPPAQYDLRRAPVYVPARSAAPRAGSLDFKRVASHGYGC